MYGCYTSHSTPGLASSLGTTVHKWLNSKYKMNVQDTLIANCREDKLTWSSWSGRPRWCWRRAKRSLPAGLPTRRRPPPCPGSSSRPHTSGSSGCSCPGTPHGCRRRLRRASRAVQTRVAREIWYKWAHWEEQRDVRAGHQIHHIAIIFTDAFLHHNFHWKKTNKQTTKLMCRPEHLCSAWFG